MLLFFSVKAALFHHIFQKQAVSRYAGRLRFSFRQAGSLNQAVSVGQKRLCGNRRPGQFSRTAGSQSQDSFCSRLIHHIGRQFHILSLPVFLLLLLFLQNPFLHLPLRFCPALLHIAVQIPSAIQHLGIYSSLVQITQSPPIFDIIHRLTFQHCAPIV